MKTTAYSEVELVERAVDDLDAFGDLVERYRGSIYRQCYSSVRDRDYAEDLAQETFIRAYLRLSQLKDPARFPNWLRKIAANVCHEFARSAARRELAWETLPEPIDRRLVVSVEGLEALPSETRACVELFYRSGLSYSEIAQALDSTVASVKARLQRAKAVLRKEMVDMAPTERSAFTKGVLDKLEQLSSHKPYDRARAARDIRTALAEDEVAKIVHGLMNDPDVWGRRDIYNAAEAMCGCRRHRNPRVRDGLVHVLLTHRMEEMRLKAAGLLAAQRDPEAIPALRQAMKDPKNPKEVIGAAKSTIKYLESLDVPTASEEARLRLRIDIDRAANDKQARVELLRKLKTALRDPEPAVRNQAVKALAELGDKRAVPAISRLLDDPVSGVRQAAAIALGDLTSAAALPALLSALHQWTDRQELQALLTALYRIGDHSALPALLKLLEDTRNGNLIVMSTTPIVAVIAADDLERLRHTISVAREGGTRFHCFLDWLWISSLAKVGDERYVAEIERLIRAGHREPCLYDALARMRSPEALAALREQLYTDPHGLAADALIQAGESGRAVMREALSRNDEAVILAVCRCFSHAGGDFQSARRFKEIANTAQDAKTRAYAQRAWRKSAESPVEARARKR